MISLAPPLSFRHLIRAVLRPDPNVSDRKLAMPWLRAGYQPFWFSKSAWSLVVITQWFQSVHPKPQCHVWIPDYFCNQSLVGLRSNSITLVFYPIDASMQPDWAACNALAQKKPPHLFLLVHYFGQVSHVMGARDFCHRHQAIFIEDCAHALLPVEGMGNSGDFVLYSPHKSLALPDGALLLAHPRVMKRMAQNSDEFLPTFEPVVAKFLQQPQQPSHVWFWVLKRIVQRLLPNVIATMRNDSRPSSKSLNEQTSVRWTVLPKQSELSRQLLVRYIPTIESYAWIRYYHAVLWMHWLSKKNGFTPSIPQFPYLLGVPCASSVVQQQYLQARDIPSPLTTWPDLPPEVLQHPEYHKTAIELQEKIIFYPIHHGIRPQRMRRDTSNMPLSSSGLRLKWDLASATWEMLFDQVPKSSLSQSAFYAKALHLDRKWTPRFGAIEVDGHVVGLWVILEKRGPLGLTAARLNRGPIWLHEEHAQSLIPHVFAALREHYSIRRGRLLWIAPNVPLTSEYLIMLSQLQFKRRFIAPWTSVWVDLSQSESALKASMVSTWRNQLMVAMRHEMLIEISQDASALEWLLAHHEQHMKEHGYGGPRPRFVRHLQKTAQDVGDCFFVLRAAHDACFVAGIAVIRHGTSATYFIGCTLEAGRSLYATNLLLWRAMILLKSKGCAWFDLGGINPYLTPGITAFKRGLNGEPYRLIGEYISY